MNTNQEGTVTETVEEYIRGLSQDRAEAIAEIRRLIRENLPEGYAEIMDFGMICYVIPLDTYPETYNGHPLMYVALGSQKRHMSLYLMNVYGNQEAAQCFTEGFAAAGKKLDMGKACVRFKKLDDLPLDLIGEAIGRTSVAEYIAGYEASRAEMMENRRSRRKQKKDTN